VCAWCGKQIRSGDKSLPVSHGICVSCIGCERGVDDLTHLSQGELDSLPFGVIRLDGEGTVVAYNQTESGFSHLEPGQVIGKNFFSEVAPCARVKEFAGAIESFRAATKSGRKRISFVFTFPHGAMWMSIALTYDAQDDETTLLVKPLATESLKSTNPSSAA
jgi:photoactive yellow protein